MKIYMDTLTKQVEEMDNTARGAEEKSITVTMQREISSGDVARDFKFFE